MRCQYFGFCRNIDSEVGILRCVAAHVALRVLPERTRILRSTCRGHPYRLRPEPGQSRLVETIGEIGDDGRIDGVAEIRMRGNVLVKHLGNFVRGGLCLSVDDFVTCRCFGGGRGLGGGFRCRASVAVSYPLRARVRRRPKWPVPARDRTIAIVFFIAS